MLILNRTPFAQLHNEMGSLLDSMFADVPGRIGTGKAVPPMNLWEDGQKLFIEAELPGRSIQDIEVSVVDNEVTISGKRIVDDVNGATYLRRERSTGEFSRSWTLPFDVDADRVEASLTNGILLVALAKSEKALPRKIHVRGA